MQQHLQLVSALMHMPLLKVDSYGLPVFIGQMKLVLMATLMAMWQHMQSVMRSLRQLV
jgi:hypothetical protein